ncbi:MAG: hypothetical protein J6T77_04085 [Clostridia bacterium]|nr:hypothetical protein [Clostridia bacterium]
MKRIASVLILFALLVSLLVSCAGEDVSGPEQTDESSAAESGAEPVSEESSEEESKPMTPDENAKLIWQERFADPDSGLGSPDDIYGADYYFDGALTNDYSKDYKSGDSRFVFRGKENSRVVNFADGYMLTVPYADVACDLSLGEFRTKLVTSEAVINITYEDQNPYYKNGKSGWETYLTEWLVPRIDDLDFLNANNIMRSSRKEVLTDVIDGYEIIEYHMFIKQSKNIEHPYYNIAIIRKADQYKDCILVVMKSKNKATEQFQGMIASMDFFAKECEKIHYAGQYELKIPEQWNDETRAYYDKLMNQTDVDWGFFYEGNNDDYIAWMQSPEALDYTPEIFMTYLHIGWYDTLSYLKTDFIEKHAGGNGFNGKPVLNLTYQFTTTNNSIAGYTPMFDIMRGKYDDHFRRLAADIKAYGKPVIFRLNNEMNTDWTSYAGIVTLLDPDIFVITWRRLYDIFKEEGVDNCIWVFNPITVTCPYCDWGEFACYYPGADYCQMLGLTYYEPGNSSMDSFKNIYTKTYDKYKDYFIDYPWMIGEFACGAGGAKVYDWGSRSYRDTAQGRSESQQTTWCREMFKCFANNQAEANRFCRNIKIAVWFSANDYVSLDGTNYVLNYYKLDEALDQTFAVFREWLPKLHQ